MTPTREKNIASKWQKRWLTVLMHILHLALFLLSFSSVLWYRHSVLVSSPIKQHMGLFCCIERCQNHFHGVMHENAFKIWLRFHGFKIQLEFEPGCDDVIVHCLLEPLMSSGSPALISLAFLDRFQYSLTVPFFFCPVSTGVHLGNANIVFTLRPKACLLGTNPAHGIAVMMWDELVRNYSCFHFSLMFYNTVKISKGGFCSDATEPFMEWECSMEIKGSSWNCHCQQRTFDFKSEWQTSTKDDSFLNQ